MRSPCPQCGGSGRLERGEEFEDCMMCFGDGSIDVLAGQVESADKWYAEAQRLRRVLEIVARGYGRQDHTAEWQAGRDALDTEGFGS